MKAVDRSASSADRRAECGPLDSWVLLAVLLCGRKGGTLRDLLATGDYANHAVMPFERLRDGLFALQHAGLVLHAEGRYRAAPRATSFWTSTGKRERRLTKQWDLLDRWLGKQRMSPVAANVRRITKKKYDEATREYLANP